MLSKFSVMILLWLGMMYSNFCIVSAIAKLGYKLIYIRWRKTYCNRIVKPWVLTMKSQRMFSFKTVDTHNYGIQITQWLIKVFTRLKRNSCHSLEGSFVSSAVVTAVVFLRTHFIRTVKEHSSKAFHHTQDKRFI